MSSNQADLRADSYDDCAAFGNLSCPNLT